jgi:hypothetical protein
MRFPLPIGVAAVVLASAAAAQAQMRFRGLDTNGDGVITRSEWRGNDTSFRSQDWNGDGVLSGDEVRPGARRQANWSQDWNRDGRVDNYDSQISQRFRGYDMNNDGRVGRSEWPGDGRLFTRLDTNRDGFLTIQEYTQGGGFTLDSQGGPSFRFSDIDMNRDGWVTRDEWHMTNADFDRLDVNRDNHLSRFEFENDTAAYHDSRYSREQFGGPEKEGRSAAWRTGYDRGIQEGRAAGREDYTRRQGWDLEGQRELQRADSGYTPQVGTLSDYQAGYREGFRNAYHTGFMEAGGLPPQ